jgi:hypothetical protein
VSAAAMLDVSEIRHNGPGARPMKKTVMAP